MENQILQELKYLRENMVTKTDMLALNTRIDKLDNRMEKMEKRMEKMETRTDKLEKRVDNLEISLISLRADFEDFQEFVVEEFNKLHNTLDTIYNGLQVSTFKIPIIEQENTVKTHQIRRIENWVHPASKKIGIPYKPSENFHY